MAATSSASPMMMQATARKAFVNLVDQLSRMKLFEHGLAWWRELSDGGLRLDLPAKWGPRRCCCCCGSCAPHCCC